MIQVLFKLAVFTSLIFLLACGKSGTNDALTVTDIFNPEKGDWRSVRVTNDFYIDGEQGTNYPTVSYNYEEYSEVIGSNRYGELQSVDYYPEGSEEPTSTSFECYNNGMFKTLSGINDQVAVIRLAEPIEIGKTWTTYNTWGDKVEVQFEIISVDETVTVPAGTFSCIHVVGVFEDDYTNEFVNSQQTGNQSQDFADGSYGLFNVAGDESCEMHRWFSPDVGWVKSELIANSTNEHPYCFTKRYELVDFGP